MLSPVDAGMKNKPTNSLKRNYAIEIPNVIGQYVPTVRANPTFRAVEGPIAAWERNVRVSRIRTDRDKF